MIGFVLHFLTEEWVWEEPIEAASLDDARAAAEAGLAKVVAEETPVVACVTIEQDGTKLGILDWVDARAVWTAMG